MEIILIGAGSMAIAYAKVLKHQGHTFKCFGRGAGSAEKFLAETGVTAGTGPLDEQLKGQEVSDAYVIVAVNVMELSSVCSSLLDAGVARILVEKPGAVDLAGMQALAQADTGDRLRIAYNRRFLKSTQKALEIIKADGGVQSVHFEFTELPDRLEGLNVHPAEVLANLAYANSSHVFDMAFYLGQTERSMEDVSVAGAQRQGSIVWHPNGSRFASCGAIGDRSLYTCFADWRSGGNWSVEVSTAHRRLRLRPLETLTEQLRETFAVNEVTIEADPDGLKPGLPDMVANFLQEDGCNLPTMKEQAARMAVFAKMLSQPS